MHSFASKSLLTLSSDGKRVSFHDLQHDFLRLNVESLADAHGALIEAYRRRCAGGWASGPDDGYFFQFLPHHLATAGRLDEVKALLADYAWIKAKLKAISEYVNWVLDREDRRFLEDQLVPLMVREEHYSNMITEADINAARGDLYEMIYSNQKNQHFRRLCDTNILVLEDQYTWYTQKTQRIRFKHESFYEYFIGKRLASLSEMQADRYAFFLRLIEETTAKPFLWDAARNALVKEASKLNSETILKLCRTTEQRVKEMIVNVLIGLDSLEQREGLLSNLIPQEKPASEWQKLRRLVSKPAAEADLRTRIAGKIAIEVASTLKLRQILQTAALHPDPAMRAMAVRYSYYLWQHDRGAGFAVLQYLADNATSGIIPNFLAIESVFGLSFIIVCDSYNDEEVTSMVQSIWHGMIATLFRLRGGDSRWNGIVINFIRERLIALVIAHVFTLLHELPPNNMMHYDAVEAFFQLTPADKSLYRRLVRYFDVTGDYSRTQMKQDYLAVLEIDNVLLRLITTMGLVAHSWAAPHAFLPFLKQLFEAAKRHITTYPYLRAIHNVPISILQRDPMNDEMFEFFVYTAEVSQEYYTRYPEKYQSNASGPPPQAAGIGSYITFQYRRKGTVRTPWLETRIQAALKKRDLRLFEFLLSSELPDQAINQLAPEAVLAALELFFKSENAAITDMIQALLSRLRLYYPDQVDDFLEHQQAPDEFRLQVRTHEPNEKVGDLIGMRAWYFVRDSVLLGPAEGRAQLVECFEKAAEYKDTRAWVDYLIRHLVNLIYGGKALREPA